MTMDFRQDIRLSDCDGVTFRRWKWENRIAEETRRTEIRVEQAYAYLTTSTYPAACTENKKRVIRKKSCKFLVKDGELCYKQKKKGQVHSYNHNACRNSLRLVTCNDNISLTTGRGVAAIRSV